MTRSACSISLTIVAFLLQSCVEKQTVVETVPLGDPFEVRADQYSLKYYFVDTSYIPLYESFYQNDPPQVSPNMEIEEAEVWVQAPGSGYGPSDRLGVAWINLPSRSASGYDSSYRITSEVPGTVEVARFYQIGFSSSFPHMGQYLGVLSCAFEGVPDLTIAIAYRRADGTRYGDFVRDNGNDSTPLVLKLVKPRNLFSIGPRYRVAWQMLLKNIYPIQPGHISRKGFQFDVLHTNRSNRRESEILGQPLLKVLGLDRFAPDGISRPEGDGQFDFRPGMTVYQDEGEIILPYVRPFDTGIRHYFVEHGLPVPDSAYFSPEVYDSARVVAQQSLRNKYLLRGRAIVN